VVGFIVDDRATREAIRTAISEVAGTTSSGRALEALKEFRNAADPQTVLDLIDAFEQDQRITRYETFDQLLDYCSRSADPVGRLVLYMCGYRDEHRQRLSDKTCSALQLTNFWQDVRRDIVERDRIYIPADSMRRFNVTEEQIRQGRCDENYRRVIQFEVERAQAMFDEGKALLPLLHPSIRKHIALFGMGGEAILSAIRRQNYDTLTRRPARAAWTACCWTSEPAVTCCSAAWPTSPSIARANCLPTRSTRR
jgi:squalene synthase HpnC